jgi:hypothetical protein
MASPAHQDPSHRPPSDARATGPGEADKARDLPAVKPAPEAGNTAQAGRLTGYGELADEAAAKKTLDAWLQAFLKRRGIGIPTGVYKVIADRSRGGEAGDIAEVGGWLAVEAQGRRGPARGDFEIAVAEFVYDLVRDSVANRGIRDEDLGAVQQKVAGSARLGEVLRRREGDCVGMAKAYCYVSSKYFGLDVGIVEVKEGLDRQEEPHVCCMLKTSPPSQLRQVDVTRAFSISPVSRGKRHPLIRLRAQTDGGMADLDVLDREFGRLDPAKAFGLPDESVHAFTRVQEAGNIEFKTRDARESLRLLDEAVRLDPGLAFAYSNRAATRLKIEPADLGGVVADAEAALSLHPRMEAPKINLAYATLQQGFPDRVIGLIGRYLSPVGQDRVRDERHKAMLTEILSMAYSSKGETDKARLLLGEAEKLYQKPTAKRRE